MTNSFLLPELQAASYTKVDLRRAFLFNARFNYSAAPRVLKFYRTVYLLKKWHRSFHTVALPFRRRLISTVWKVFFDAYCTFGTTGLYTRVYSEQLWFPLNEIHQPQLLRVNQGKPQLQIKQLMGRAGVMKPPRTPKPTA